MSQSLLALASRIGPTTLDDFAAACRDTWARLRIDIDAADPLDSAPIASLVELDGDRIAALRTYPSEQPARKAARR